MINAVNEIAQLELVYKCFLESPKTMKEVDKEIGIMRENICWYVRELKNENRIWPIHKRKCRVTKHIATAWTTNKLLIPKNPQLNLWNDESSK